MKESSDRQWERIRQTAWPGIGIGVAGAGAVAGALAPLGRAVLYPPIVRDAANYLENLFF